jgi:cytochrome b subunit of formate dehydrogenase
MLKKILFAVFFAGILAASIYWIRNLNVVLFQSAAWTLLVPMVMGITLGITRRKRKYAGDSDYSGEEQRHSIDSFMEHWGTASGILILVYSGFQIRTGTGGFFGMNLHFLGLFYALLFGCYFIVDFFASRKYDNVLPSMTDIVDGTIKKYLLKYEPRETGKYLSSQKSAFLVFALVGAEIIITGGVKLAAHFWRIPYQVMEIITPVHDIFGILLVLMFLFHVFLVISVRSHRRLLRSWFSGRTSASLE